MDYSSLSTFDIQLLRENFTSQETKDDHFRKCWSQQTCNGCMKAHHCSWCPFTWSCVPNSYKIPALAPAWDENICPHWAERWEVRTHPLGCQVSTITSLTSLISIASTLVFLLLVWLLVWAFRRLRRYTKQHPGWWRPSRYRWWRALRGGRSGEQEPLLPERQDPTATEAS